MLSNFPVTYDMDDIYKIDGCRAKINEKSR